MSPLPSLTRFEREDAIPPPTLAHRIVTVMFAADAVARMTDQARVEALDRALATLPEDARSTPFCTDIAKAIQAPIFHVNGDDPEACVRVAHLAWEYRQRFHKDVVIDMVCYRRYGHNEGDDPSYTQPLMYKAISERRSVRKLYVESLVKRGDITVEEAYEHMAGTIAAGRLGRPGEVGDACAYLCSAQAGFISGQNLQLDGGSYADLAEAGAYLWWGISSLLWRVALPLLSPTTFFLLVVNIVYAFFDTFGIIHAVTRGGPAQATNILVYKVYSDGFIGLNLGSSAAQSIVLMSLIIGITFLQFKYVERKVHYTV